MQLGLGLPQTEPDRRTKQGPEDRPIRSHQVSFGDVWRLGESWLFCGDSGSETNFA